MRIQVIDTGVGISEENQEKLFKLFGFLTDTQSMNTKGVGLGLAISSKIIQQFGGKIKVVSEPGKGSNFSFWFQLEKAESNS